MVENKLPWNLIVSKLRCELSLEQEAVFREWLRHGNNRELFRQLEMVWEKVQKKAPDYEPDVERCWRELSARIRLSSGTNRRQVKMSHRKFSLYQANRYFSKVAVVLFLVLAAAFWGVYYLGKYNSDHTREYLTYSTSNSKTKVLLPDSTEVWLHNNSSITYSYNPKNDRREVKLAGEGYFDVKHEADRPFVVTAGDVQVTVYGTQFNVNTAVAADGVLVSLFEGSVSMAADKCEAIFLQPGEEGLFEAGNDTIAVSEGDMELAKVWICDKIRFENKNLREVCLYLSKWYGISFEIDPLIDDEQSYTFTFKGQPLGEVVEVLTDIHLFDYSINSENNVVQIKKRRSMEHEG